MNKRTKKPFFFEQLTDAIWKSTKDFNGIMKIRIKNEYLNKKKTQKRQGKSNSLIKKKC